MNIFTRALEKIRGKNMTPEEAFLRGLPIYGGTGTGAQGVRVAYERSSVAYAAIRRIATDAGNAPFLLLTDPEDPASRVPDNHPIALLFNTPNPWFSTGQFMESIYTYLNLRGEFFVVFDDPNRPTEMIQFYDPLYWRETVNSEYRLAYWDFNYDTIGFRAVPSDVLHHRLNSVRNPFRGQSPLVAATQQLWTGIWGADLGLDLIQQGGEQGIVYSTDEKLTPTQEEQLSASLKARRKNAAKIANDILLTGGMGILDPKFTGFDYALFDLLPPSDQKVLEVFGLSPSLIGRDDEPNYATFEGRLRIYWRNTLLPMMTGVESTFDKFFEEFGVYFRYDKQNIRGLQDDLKEMSQIATILNRGGVPWTVLNDRLNLGLDVDLIPGADEVMVPMSNAPLSVLLDEFEYVPYRGAGASPVEPKHINPPPTKADDKGLPDFDTARKRAEDIPNMIERNRALAGMEKAVASGWRKQQTKYKALAVAEMTKALDQNHTLEGGAAQFQKNFSPIMVPEQGEYNVDSVDLIHPRHISAAGVGIVSIAEITRQLDPSQMKFLKQEPEGFFSERTVWFIRQRQNLVAGMGKATFQGMMSEILKVINEGGEYQDVLNMVKNTFNVTGSRAKTIARTEIGTAYNVGRWNSMKEAGYSHSVWRTNIDEVTRELHRISDNHPRRLGHYFPCGLLYPMEPGGRDEQARDASNKINCRCLTIPMTEEQYRDRFPDYTYEGESNAAVIN